MSDPDPWRTSQPSSAPTTPKPQPVEPWAFRPDSPGLDKISRHRSWPDNSLLVHPSRHPKASQPPTHFFTEVEQPGIKLAAPIVISCHCKRIRGIIDIMPRDGFGDDGKCSVDLNHDVYARKFSGQLAISYFPIFQPGPDFLGNTVEFQLKCPELGHLATLYFCPVCGCHIFKQVWTTIPTTVLGNNVYGPVWGVASGVATMESGTAQAFTIGHHIGVDTTGDGGLSAWMPVREDGTTIHTNLSDRDRDLLLAGNLRWPLMLGVGPSPSFDDSGPEVLTGSCACGTVRFHVTRPNAHSLQAKSQYPDLMIPYESKSSQILNFEDDKWWIRPSPPPELPVFNHPGGGQEPTKNRYLAGNCACTSCRTTSGFNIQSWAFIPRVNIFMHLPDDSVVPLDFMALPVGLLRSYLSSYGVVREFCPGCGATVFWHNSKRPELIDVSVGLFNARGARAEDWLDWWMDRVSFSEERFGVNDQEVLWNPVTCLEMGIKRVGMAYK